MIYTFSISQDTLRSAISLSSLDNSIRLSTASQGYSHVKSDGDILSVVYNAELSQDYVTVLTNVVNAHDAVKAAIEAAEPQRVQVVAQSEPEPFARPTFRTKRDGALVWKDVGANNVIHSDYVMSKERYVSGGECIVIGSKKGDWISAEVIDRDLLYQGSGIEAVSENYPMINKYVLRANLIPDEKMYKLDTYPLNARIIQGLVLRITYHASAEIGLREFTSNYYLTERIV